VAFDCIEPFLRNHKSIWDPAAGSELFPVKDYFEHKGYRVVTSDILESKDYDFMSFRTKKRYEIIVTTPPYSLRKEFVIRACQLKKPFAFLVPVNILESKTIRDSIRDCKLSLIFPSKTVNFVSSTDNKSVKNLPYSIWIVGNVQNVPSLEFVS
jgi:hypothetical protein